MTVHTVVDPDARIRTGPPHFRWRDNRRIPRFTRVSITRTETPYVRVTGLQGKAYGWTALSNLVAFYKDRPDLGAISLEPDEALAVSGSWGAERRSLAALYNRLGGIVRALSTVAAVEVASCLAVWKVESSGRRHTVGRATIRFENHHLFRLWGDAHAAVYDRHFRHGGRPGASGKPWRNHLFRETAASDFEPVHRSQASEYRALALARRLAPDGAALPCISIGGPQILISNHRSLGYRQPARMYDAFQASERSHVLGFFDFCQVTRSNGGDLIDSLRSKNWNAFAAAYNGSGNVDVYGPRLRDAHATAATLPRLAPRASPSATGRSVRPMQPRSVRRASGETR